MNERQRILADDSHGNTITDPAEYEAAKRMVSAFPELTCTLTLPQVAVRMRGDKGGGNRAFEPRPDECPVCGSRHIGAAVRWTFHLAIHESGDARYEVCAMSEDHSYLDTLERHKRFATPREAIRYIAGFCGGYDLIEGFEVGGRSDA